jgi:Ca-activated chloride channel homolog
VSDFSRQLSGAVIGSCVSVPLTLVVATAVAFGQPRAIFTVSSDLVVVHATVTERRGTYVSGLTQDAFQIFEDGSAQAISFFAEQDAPVTVGLLVDDSGSMWPHRERVVAAVQSFASVSNPEDELFALAFNERVRAALPPTSPFTIATGALHEALAATLIGRGLTAMHDAVVAGLEYVMLGTRERRALIVVSDGGDNASAATESQMLRAAQASDAVIYTVGLVDPAASNRDANPRLLRRLAETTGGQAFNPKDSRRVGEVLESISRDIRHSYTLGYVSTNPRRDGALRRIEVRVQAPERRRLDVRTRGGYLAPSDPEDERHP